MCILLKQVKCVNSKFYYVPNYLIFLQLKIIYMALFCRMRFVIQLFDIGPVTYYYPAMGPTLPPPPLVYWGYPTPPVSPAHYYHPPHHPQTMVRILFHRSHGVPPQKQTHFNDIKSVTNVLATGTKLQKL